MPTSAAHRRAQSAPHPDPEKLAKTIARWVRDERIRAGLTRHELARELDLTDGAPVHWEMGRNMPGADRIGQLAIVFGFSLVVLKTMLEQLAAETRSGSDARR